VRKAESILSTEINLINISEAKTSHPTTELVVILNEDHFLRALADTGASSNIILEKYTLKQLIKHDE
jgi:hypothetical protein